jgi:hypothetical protein
MNKDQAVDQLMYADQRALASATALMYEEQYDGEPDFLFNYTVPQLVSWILYHYDWDLDAQCWTSIVPHDADQEMEVCNFNIPLAEARTVH